MCLFGRSTLVYIFVNSLLFKTNDFLSPSEEKITVGVQTSCTYVLHIESITVGTFVINILSWITYYIR